MELAEHSVPQPHLRLVENYEVVVLQFRNGHAGRALTAFGVAGHLACVKEQRASKSSLKRIVFPQLEVTFVVVEVDKSPDVWFVLADAVDRVTEDGRSILELVGLVSKVHLAQCRLNKEHDSELLVAALAGGLAEAVGQINAFPKHQPRRGRICTGHSQSMPQGGSQRSLLAAVPEQKLIAKLAIKLAVEQRLGRFLEFEDSVHGDCERLVSVRILNRFVYQAQ